MTNASSVLRPYLLAPDNFTPPARTPWGGTRIVEQFKAGLPLAQAVRKARVGEAWELSFGPELPSRTNDGAWLSEIVAADLPSQLGSEASRGASALLVKWLDAADDLSVQIHPDVHQAGLARDETGKPECWYIVAAEPGAGVYLGLQSGVNAAQMEHALEHGEDVSKLLRFQPVKPGDFFLLPPGLPHAVGRGCTLVEPQYVFPGKKAVTLRYWDWNRRYDESGKLDAKGRSRELHVARALAVTDWVNTSDPEWLARQRTSLGAPELAASASSVTLCGPEPGVRVHSQYLRVTRLAGQGASQLPDWGTLRGLTVIEGSVTLHGAFGELHVARGATAAVGAGLGALACQLNGAHAIVSSVVA